MKKTGLLLIVFLIGSYCITGCGGGGGGGNSGGGDDIGSVSGKVVDFTNPLQGVANIVVKIGSKTAITDDNGNFSITGVPVGTYWVIASGSDSGLNHLAGNAYLSVVKGSNSCSPIQVYNIEGYGVTGVDEVTMSSVNVKSFGTQSIKIFSNNSMKNSIHHESIPMQPKINMFNSLSNSLFNNASLLDNRLAYFYLHWKPLTGVVNPIYKIYLGTSEDATKKVWDSSIANYIAPAQYPSGTAWDASNPKAYLDLDDELKDQVINAGVHQFLIVVYDSDTKYQELPSISISIGMNSAPTNLRRTGNQLSWSQASNANKYILGIYSDAAMTVEIQSSDLPQSATSFSYDNTKVTSPGTYYWIIESYVNDEAGWPMEINAGLSAFELEL